MKISYNGKTIRMPDMYLYETEVRYMDLYEEKSISDNVKSLTSAVFSVIKEDLNVNSDIWYETFSVFGKNYRIPYKHKSRKLYVDLLPIFGVDKRVRIKYKVYVISKRDPYYRLLEEYAYGECDGESSFENGWIRVTTYIEDGVLSDGFIPSIQHEASHYFQEFKGQEKNVSLYSGAVNLLRSANELESNIGLSLYYAFPTEQDAFTNQFYAWLMNAKSPNQMMSTFEAAKPYSIYPIFKKCSSAVKRSNLYDVERVLSKIGMTLSQYRRYINKADQRLQNKLRHAFDKYLIDKKKGNISERVFTSEELNDKQVFADNFLTDKHRDFCWNSQKSGEDDFKTTRALPL